MEAKLIWLLIFVGLYWAYCLFWGFRGALRSRTSADYFVAGRSIGIWVFVLAATATSFSGWTFVGHPGLILEAGLPLCVRFLLCADDSVYRRAFPEATMAHREGVSAYHARRDVFPLLRRRYDQTADGTRGVSFQRAVSGCPASSLGVPVQRAIR